MASEQNTNYLVHEKPNQPPKPSNEDRLYGIGGSLHPEGFITPRLPQLKTYGWQTYTSRKLRTVTATARRPNERDSSAVLSQYIGSAPSRDDQRQFTSPAMMQSHGQPVDDPLDNTLLTDKPQRANAQPPLKLNAAIRKELREVSKDNTPVAKRMDRRRQKSRAVGHDPIIAQAHRQRANAKLPAKPLPTAKKELRELSRDNTPVAKRMERRRQKSLVQAKGSGLRKVSVHDGQAGEKSAAELQSTSKIVQADQHADSQDSNGTEESLNLVEMIRKTRHKQAYGDDNRRHYITARKLDGRNEISALVEFEDSDSEPTVSPESEEILDVEKSIRKVPQQSQSLLDIAPKDKLSSVKVSRQGNPPVRPEEEDESPESAGSDDSNQE
jgi:hypothetical protein